MSKIIAGILGCMFLLSFVGKENNIYWSKDHQLKWEDFLGKTPANSKHGAISNIGVDPHYDCSNGMLEVEIKSYFDKTKSWSKKDKQTPEALKHEQGHFDIAEFYARKFRKEMQENKFKSTNVKNKFDKINQKVIREHAAYQDLYDKETDHHKNASKQTEWNDKITKELAELEAYSETHLSIKVK